MNSVRSFKSKLGVMKAELDKLEKQEKWLSENEPEPLEAISLLEVRSVCEWYLDIYRHGNFDLIDGPFSKNGEFVEEIMRLVFGDSVFTYMEYARNLYEATDGKTEALGIPRNI